MPPSCLRSSARRMVCCSSSPTRIEARFDLGAIERGAQQALPQQPSAHAGAGLIEHAAAALSRASPAKTRLHQFQVAHGDGVEHHGLGAVVEGGPVEVIERGALRVAQIVQDGARGARRPRASGEAAAIEREQLKVLAQRAVGVVVGEDPVFELGARR